MPLSHLLTADSVTKSLSANSRWVSPSSFRRRQIYAPKVFLFSMLNHPLRQSLVLQGRSHHTANGVNLQGPSGIFPLDR